MLSFNTCNATQSGLAPFFCIRIWQKLFTFTFPEENSRLQSRCFREFRNSAHCKMLPMKIQEKKKKNYKILLLCLLCWRTLQSQRTLCLLNHLARLLSGTVWPSCRCTLSRLRSPAWHPNNLQLLQSIPHSPPVFLLSP